MTDIYLAFGSNIGHKQETIQKAIANISEHSAFTLIKQSSFYQSEALLYKNQDDFINAVVQFSTTFSPKDLLNYIQKVENIFGRNRSQEIKYGPRTLDIDIIFYGNDVIMDENLQIPHPEFQKRKFVLLPLAEINLNYSVAKIEKTIGELLDLCPDKSKIERL